jgi:hypothetical protein
MSPSGIIKPLHKHVNKKLTSNSGPRNLSNRCHDGYYYTLNWKFNVVEPRSVVIFSRKELLSIGIVFLLKLLQLKV